jgi:hypothetical protein
MKKDFVVTVSTPLGTDNFPFGIYALALSFYMDTAAQLFDIAKDSPRAIVLSVSLTNQTSGTVLKSITINFQSAIG